VSVERRNLLIAVVVAFVFGVSGGLVGALGAVSYFHRHGGPSRYLHGPDRPGDPAVRGRPRRGGRPGMERVLHRELGLSETQRRQVERILDDARPRYAAVRESTHAEILRVLTPEQQAKWRELEDRLPGRRRDRAER
jgi:Spy/CpxP family protein refolding chaperone